VLGGRGDVSSDWILNYTKRGAAWSITPVKIGHLTNSEIVRLADAAADDFCYTRGVSWVLTGFRRSPWTKHPAERRTGEYLRKERK
jgi:hypothetical protein